MVDTSALKRARRKLYLVIVLCAALLTGAVEITRAYAFSTTARAVASVSVDRTGRCHAPNGRFVRCPAKRTHKVRPVRIAKVRCIDITGRLVTCPRSMH